MQCQPVKINQSKMVGDMFKIVDSAYGKVIHKNQLLKKLTFDVLFRPV